MKKRKWLVRFIAFGFLTIIVIFGISRFSLLCLDGAGGYDTNHKHIYELEENTLDVIFVGSSHCYCGFIPAELYERYGMSSYNLSSPNQSMLSNYLWAKEIYEKKKYKVVVVEAMSITMSHGDVGNDIRSLNGMGLSKNYFELIKTYKRESINVIFPIIDFHDSWESITFEHFKGNSYEEDYGLRGYVPIFSNTDRDRVVTVVDENDSETLGYLKYPYLDKLRVFCDENGIELLIVKTPIANGEVNNWNTGLHNSLEAYCNQYGIEFLDFNCASLQELSGVYPELAVAEDERHCNYYGASLITDYLGKYILDHYDVASSTTGFSEANMNIYHSVIEQLMLNGEE